MDSAANHVKAEEMNAALNALKLTSLSCLPMALKAAVELDLLEIIAKAGPGAHLSASDLATQLPTNNPDAADLLDRILRLLSSFSLLKCTLKHLPDGRPERLYGLAPMGKYYTKENGGSFAALLLMAHNKTFFESWHYYKDAILDGVNPFEKAHGIDSFGYFRNDSTLSKVFNAGMSDYTSIVINKVLEIYEGFQGLQTLVDVGGGIGVTINAIVSKYPSIKGINFDVPHVIKKAPSYPGVVHIGGDMFASVPKGDAIFMKAICHDWADDQCILILKNCYESLPENGKVIIADYVLPEFPDNTYEAQFGFLVDVAMLAYNQGAKERTEKEFESLAKKAGFKSFHKICCAYTTWIMELKK